MRFSVYLGTLAATMAMATTSDALATTPINLLAQTDSESIVDAQPPQGTEENPNIIKYVEDENW